MRKDLELWARYQVEVADWRERSTWFNVRLRELERYEQALKRGAPDVIENRPPYTLDDVRQTLNSYRDTLQSIEDRLIAIVEMRERVKAEKT